MNSRTVAAAILHEKLPELGRAIPILIPAFDSR